jgi:aryl-alcohol dehydrogenase-like predicted oxidoreductase
MLEHRQLGKSGISVTALGLGCMSMSGNYGKGDDAVSTKVLHRALELGIDFFDSADVYGNGHNETLIGKAFRDKRGKLVLATKFGNHIQKGTVDGRPEYVMEACEASLKRLGFDHIDLYYAHRIDPNVPIEDTVGAMAKLVQQGKVRALGLSEAHPDTIRRAHKVHPISAIQTEYSLLYRKEAEETLALTRELGISFVAYSPLGRSMLTGEISSTDQVKGDRREEHPRFQPDNLKKNLQLVAKLQEVATEKKCTVSQLALAWLLAQGKDIIPIPGTKRMERMEENVGALSVKLTPEEIRKIEAAVPRGSAAGERYPEGALKRVYR